MTARKSPDRTGPLDVATAASRICALIAQAPDEAAIQQRIRAAIAEERAGLQQKIDALAARVTEPEKLGRVLLAMCDKDGLRGFAVMAQENDVTHGDPAEAENLAHSGDEIPERLRQPLSPEREAIGRRR